MIAAEKAGKTPQAFVARLLRGASSTSTAFIFPSQLELHRLARKYELSQDIYRKLKAEGLIATKTIEQFYDPVKGMFLPDRYIKGECPVCHSKASTATPARSAARCMRRRS